MKDKYILQSFLSIFDNLCLILNPIDIVLAAMSNRDSDTLWAVIRMVLFHHLDQTGQALIFSFHDQKHFRFIDYDLSIPFVGWVKPLLNLVDTCHLVSLEHLLNKFVGVLISVYSDVHHRNPFICLILSIHSDFFVA